MNDHKSNNDDIFCEVCKSTDIRIIEDYENIYGVGLFQIHDFIGQIYNDFKYHCNHCQHRF